MGLDSVELVLSFEETFQISIPNSEAEKMSTPRNVIDFLASTLDVKADAPAVVMLQRRAALWAQVVDVLRASGRTNKTLTEDQRLDEVFADRSSRRTCWKELGQQMNAKEWPRLRWFGFSTDFPASLQTLGHLVDWLSRNRRHILTREERQKLTRQDIALLVKNIVLREIGISEEKYGEEKRFVEEMGVD